LTKDEKKHLSNLADLGCILCAVQGNPGTPAEIHHPRKGTGMSMKASHFDAIPLCVYHHRSSEGLHGLGTKGFKRVYSLDEAELLILTKKALELNHG